MRLKLFGALALLSPLATCSDHGDVAMPAGGRARNWTDSSAGTVTLALRSKSPYRTTAVSAAGGIAGKVSTETAPADSVVSVTKDSKGCGDSAAVGQRANSGSLANVLVWVDGISAGKALPEVRRETVVIERCRFDPRVVAVVARSTINLLSRDRVEHVTRFFREGAGEPVAQIHTVDAGQVVPNETIASTPGIVEARCSEHPWERAFIAVFDHPYFAITDENGAFTIDGLPAGTYSVKAWHEGMAAPIEQRVVVQPGGASRLDLRVAVGP